MVVGLAGEPVYSDEITGLIERVRFTASGTFEKGDYPGAKLCVVMVQAGGGGGGGISATTAGATTAPSAGGEAGAYGESVIDVDLMATTETVTVGAAGTAGATTPANGGTGGTSSFGSLVSATGGAGGTHSGGAGTSNFTYAGGASTQTITADVAIPGAPGQPGFRLGITVGQAQGGNGGDSILGRGGSPGLNAAGNAGRGYGGGGGGAANASASAQAARTGGAGAPGIVIVDVYGGAGA